MKSLYVINGISPKLEEKWRSNLRKDFIMCKNTKGDLFINIRLNPFEAIILKRQLNKYNKRNNGVLTIHKNKGKHVA